MTYSNAKILFEEEAKTFDNVIPLLIPFYDDIYKILIDSIPFSNDSSIKILDIGCGTGTFASILKKYFPKSKITCLDIAENMIEVAKSKLNKYKKDISFCVGDFIQLNLSQEYDVIVSSFALHHIQTDNEKVQLYKNIHKALTNIGIFITADIVLGASGHIKKLNDTKWKEYVTKNLTSNKIDKELLIKYQTDDNPSMLFNHLKWMEKAGFREVETIWKYYNFAIFCGYKI